jgi:hypothetical protein
MVIVSVREIVSGTSESEANVDRVTRRDQVHSREGSAVIASGDLRGLATFPGPNALWISEVVNNVQGSGGCDPGDSGRPHGDGGGPAATPHPSCLTRFASIVSGLAELSPGPAELDSLLRTTAVAAMETAKTRVTTSA